MGGSLFVEMRMTLDLKSAALAVLACGALIPAAASAASAATTPSKGPAAAPAAKGRDLFVSAGCGGCHTLADAGASGRVGPSLDGDASLSADYIQDKVSGGSGVMPPFAGQLSEAEIHALAAYVMSAKGK